MNNADGSAAPHAATTRIGIDIGGTNLRVARLDATGAIIAQHKLAVGHAPTPEAVCEAVITHAGPWCQDAARVAVGCGVAAMLRDHAGTIANAPNLGWREVAFGPMLQARFAAMLRPTTPCTVVLHNDVNAITWGEHRFGAATQHRDVLAVFVGTGIGAGYVQGGVLAVGASNCAGELGHCKVAWGENAARCGCGGRGCVEAYAGGAAILRRIAHDLAQGESPRTVALAGSLRDANVRHVEAAAVAGDPWALALWQELATYLAVAIGNAVALINPSCVVLGGGVLFHAPLLQEMMLAAVTCVAPAPSLQHLQFVDAALGDDAGIIGASDLAALAL